MATATRSSHRYRVAPRNGRQGGGSRIRWDRLGRVVLVVVIFAVLASYVSPTLNVFDTWRDSKAAEERLATLKAENERLVRQNRELDEPTAAVAEARKLGMVAPGEQAYVIDGLE
jgi:cell division protein FtsB